MQHVRRRSIDGRIAATTALVDDAPWPTESSENETVLDSRQAILILRQPGNRADRPWHEDESVRQPSLGMGPQPLGQTDGNGDTGRIVCAPEPIAKCRVSTVP